MEAIKNAIAAYYCEECARKNTARRRLVAMCGSTLYAYHDVIDAIMDAHHGLTHIEALNAFAKFDREHIHYRH